MLGLIEKDIRLLLQRKSSFLIIVAVSILMSMTMDATFIVGYLVVLGVLFSSSTISYDEYDNGYPFLMTLPIEKKTYVAEKYVFCLGSGLCMWCVSSVLYFVSYGLRGIELDFKNDMIQLCCFLPVIILMTAIMIPFPLKYGAEKGRIVMVMVCGVIIGIGALIGKGLEKTSISLEAVSKYMNGVPASVIISLLAILLLLMLGISYLCSRHIMEHKVF